MIMMVSWMTRTMKIVDFELEQSKHGRLEHLNVLTSTCWFILKHIWEADECLRPKFSLQEWEFFVEISNHKTIHMSSGRRVCYDHAKNIWFSCRISCCIVQRIIVEEMERCILPRLVVSLSMLFAASQFQFNLCAHKTLVSLPLVPTSIPGT